ncbi:CAP domain-containing protein [Sulfobacillus thermosulfidooxidans]|uniref:CAP domain-containing protein n=1 Tax=Sulfobacillus thermosulfidooxidans TaxID=28034 RepID=UPI0006B51290|nr:CAP domain-containing protein [Sulfobacillus thermosulfidooxidans]
MAGIPRLGKIVMVLLLAFGGSRLDAGVTSFVIPPATDGILPAPATIFGPDSTQTNYGYESANTISPIIPNSYTAIRSPKFVGVQFIGDNPGILKADNFQLQLIGSKGLIHTSPLRYESNGFVGVHLKRPLLPGRYTVRFITPGFQTPLSTWSITVKPWSTAQQQSLQPYLATADQKNFIRALNAVRSRLYEAPVSWSKGLTWAAAAHARYVQQNGYHAPSFHLEEPFKPDFTGRNPWDRDMTFGWPTPLDGEVGIEWSVPMAPVAVIQNLVDTVFHRLSILSPNAVAMGTGESTGPTGAVVMDLGFGYRSTLPFAVVYPAPGQHGVPTGWIDMESPSPVVGGFSKQFGYPITVDFPTVQQLSDVHAEITWGNVTLPAVVDEPGLHDMASNQVGIVPSQVLRPDSQYQVSVTANAHFNNQSVHPIRLSWHFTTGGSDQSVAVEPRSSGIVTISVVKAGSGVPIQGEAVRIYRAVSPEHSMVVGQGVTNGEGLVSCRIPKPPRKEIFEAITASGNSAQFWW